MTKKLKIVFVAAEMTPLVKAGGLGDVVLHLSKELVRKKQEVFCFLPYYGFISTQESTANHFEKILEEEIKIDDEVFYTTLYQTKITKRLPKPLNIFLISEPKFFGKIKKTYGYPDQAQAFYFFCFATLFFIEKLNLQPDIIHCHDWHAGLIPFLIKNKIFFSDRKVPTLFTIHNMAYQGARGLRARLVPPEKKDDGKSPLPKIKDERWNLINFLKRGILFADLINTVSERYREEILTPEFGEGLEKYLQLRKADLYGIINGIDYNVHNPKFDKNIYFNYDWRSLNKKLKNKIALQKEVGLEENPEIPLIGMAHRLTEQKGFDLIIKILPTLLRLDCQIIMVGSGKKEYEKYFAKEADRHPKKMAFITPFSEKWESKIDAASDIFLLPSRFEPCGISQLKSLRYGSIPVVRKVGGLADTIKDWDPVKEEGNGFVFTNWHENDLLVAISRAIESFKYKDKWRKLVQKAMKQVFSWDLPARKYLELYKKAIEKLKVKN
ncbi:MAG: glycogen synthase [Patescibacteria group bacterium]|nr:glycogen synthase [Patescibacteria group bacterium]